MAIAIRSNGRISYPFLSAGAFTAAPAVRETGPAGAPRPRASTWSASPASGVVTTSMNPFSSAR